MPYSRYISKLVVVFLLCPRSSDVVSFAQFSDAGKFIDNYAQKNNFNGTILVKFKDWTYLKSFGMANFQFDVPNAVNTKFKIASITKLFTSVLIMQLYEQKRLDLHAPIRTYLPAYTGEGRDSVTIFHLLTATSGIANSESKDDANKVPAMFLKKYSSDEILRQYCSGKLESSPGTSWNYNNADYVILGKIIEAIYKMPFEEVLSRQLLQPLKMTGSGMCSTSGVVKDLASVYLMNDSTNKITNDSVYYIENFYAAGAMYSTAEDLLRFSEALYGGRLVKESTLKLMLTPYLADYGFGLWIRSQTINNRKIVIAERQGSIWGATTRLLYLPAEKMTIILLTNLYTTSLNKFQSEIISVLLQDL